MNLRNQEEYEHMYNIASENVRFDMQLGSQLSFIYYSQYQGNLNYLQGKHQVNRFRFKQRKTIDGNHPDNTEFGIQIWKHMTSDNRAQNDHVLFLYKEGEFPVDSLEALSIAECMQNE